MNSSPDKSGPDELGRRIEALRGKQMTPTVEGGEPSIASQKLMTWCAQIHGRLLEQERSQERDSLKLGQIRAEMETQAARGDAVLAAVAANNAKFDELAALATELRNRQFVAEQNSQRNFWVIAALIVSLAAILGLFLGVHR